MSWMNVNFESLTNIRGQISNFTKEVLSPESEESGVSSGLFPRPDKAEELEALVEFQKKQIDELKHVQSDNETKLKSADIYSAKKIEGLTSELCEKENELIALKNKLSEWGWGESCNFEEVPLNQISHDTYHNEESEHQDVAQSLEIKHLRRRILDLQADVTRLNSSKKDVGYCEDGGGSCPNCGELQRDLKSVTQPQNQGEFVHSDYDEVCRKLQESQLERKKEEGQFQSQIEHFKKQVDCQNDRLLELEKTVTHLSSQCALLKEEKNELVSSLEELDSQHQEALAQVLEKKNKLQDDVKHNIEARQMAEDDISKLHIKINALKCEVKNKYEEIQLLKTDKEHLLTNSKLPEEQVAVITVTSKENNEIMSEIEDDNSCNISVIEFQELLDQKEAQNLDLQKQCADTSNENVSLISKCTELENKYSNCEVKVLALEKSLEELKQEQVQHIQAIKNYKLELARLETFCSFMVDDAENKRELWTEEKKVQDLSVQNQSLMLGVEDNSAVHSLSSKEDTEGTWVNALDDNLRRIIENNNIDASSFYDKWSTILKEISIEWSNLIFGNTVLKLKLKNLKEELTVAKDDLEFTEREKSDLEKDCGGLRDRLEELTGSRSSPEAAHVGHLLPTIEEEEDEDGKNNEKDLPLSDDEVYELKNGENLLKEEFLNEAAYCSLESNNCKIDEGAHQYDSRPFEFLQLIQERDSLQDAVNRLTREVEDVSLKNQEQADLADKCVVLENEILRLKCIETNDCVKKEPNSEDEIKSQLEMTKMHLIYKSDQVDELRQVIDNIADIYDIKEKDFRSIFVHIKQHYDSVNKKIKEYENSCQVVERLTNELNDTKSQLNLSVGEYKAVCSKEAKTREEITHLHEIISEYENKQNKSEQEIKLIRLEKTDLLISLQANEKENSTLEQQLKERSDLLHKEHSVLARLNDDFEQHKQLKEQELNKLELMNKETVHTFSDLISQQKLEVERLREQLNEKELLIHDMKKTFLKEKEEIQNELLSERNHVESLKSAYQDKENSILLTSPKVEEVENIMEENRSLCNEKRELELEIENLKEKYKELQHSNENVLKEKNAANSKGESLEQQINALQTERQQIVTMLQHKHQESVAYHSEIQRLSKYMNEETQKYLKDRENLQELLSHAQSALADMESKYHALETEFKKAKESEVKQGEFELLRKEVDSWKIELSDAKLKLNASEQERNQLHIANAQFNSQYESQIKELQTMKEKEARLSTESERLRQHLVSVEEHYTAEAIKGEERENTLRSTLTKMEEKFNSNSHLYSSASQKAYLQVEQLEEKIKTIQLERDDATLRLQVAEESAEQNRQALSNLQQVLIDFQKSQARDISLATQRERKKFENEREKSRGYEEQVKKLKEQLLEKEMVIAAASRLTDQLDAKEKAIISLRARVNAQEESMKETSDEMTLLRSSTNTKVDKNLVRNLIVGYFATPSDKQPEVLRVIATVFDFSPEERTRAGIDTHGVSWLSSIANFLAPPPSNVRVTSKVDILDHTSLSQAFIRFLEDESAPRTFPRLPAVEMAEKSREKAEKKTQMRNQTGSVGVLGSPLPSPDALSASSSRNSLDLPAVITSPITLVPVSSASNTPEAGDESGNTSTSKYLNELLTQTESTTN